MNKWIKFGILGIIILIAIFIVINVHLPYKEIRPLPATLTIDGKEQISGIGSYCWEEALRGLCADMIGITTAKEPLPASSPFTAHLHLPLKEPPQELQLNAIQVMDDDKVKSGANGFRAWHIKEENPKEGSYSRLSLQRESDINLSLEPGVYVLEINAIWKEKGSVSYGFLLKVK